jgi:hypothetical protein
MEEYIDRIVCAHLVKVTSYKNIHIELNKRYTEKELKGFIDYLSLTADDLYGCVWLTDGFLQRELTEDGLDWVHHSYQGGINGQG